MFLKNTTILGPTPGLFATQGTEEFDDAVTAVDVIRDPDLAKGPLGRHPRHHQGIPLVLEEQVPAVDAYAKDDATPYSLRRTLWETRYPGIKVPYSPHPYAIVDKIAENPAWNRPRHPVSIDRVVSDFQLDGATETFLALPRPAQKIIALERIASQLKNEAHLIEQFAKLVENTLRSVGSGIEYDLDTETVWFDYAVAGMEFRSPEYDEFWRYQGPFIRNLGGIITAKKWEILVTSEGGRFYACGGKAVAAVGPHGVPLPVGRLLIDQHGHRTLLRKEEI